MRPERNFSPEAETSFAPVKAEMEVPEASDPVELPVQNAGDSSTFSAVQVFPYRPDSGMMLFTSRGSMSFPKVICPHCNRESADNRVCTSLGCGKRLAAPVRLFARIRTTMVGKIGSRGRSCAGAGLGKVQ